MDEAIINEMRNILEKLIPYADSMVEAYLALPFADPTLTFYNFYANTEEQAKTYNINNAPDTMNVAGPTLNKAKAAQFLEVEGMNAFLVAIKAFRANNGDVAVSYLKIDNTKIRGYGACRVCKPIRYISLEF